MNNGFSGTITSTATFNNEVQTKEIDFIYDHNGMRTGKIVSENGRVEITEYTLHGKLITHMTKRTVDEDGDETTQELHFFYDVNERPSMLEFNSEVYQFVYNVQDDVIGIIDKAGVLVVEYHYDGWGTLMFTSGEMKNTLGMLNPFTFRGYVWDKASGLYYLRSRWYNPENGRFVNADTLIVKSVLGQNVFCYCWNNSTNYVDITGAFAISAIFTGVGAVIGGVSGFLGSIASDLISSQGQSFSIKKALIEGAKGAVAGVFRNWLWGSLITLTINTVEYVGKQIAADAEIEGSVIVWEVVSAMAFGALGEGFGRKEDLLDNAVEVVYATGLNVAASKTSDKVKADAESRRSRIESDPTGSYWNMPYLVSRWNPDVGKYEEIVVNPLA